MESESILIAHPDGDAVERLSSAMTGWGYHATWVSTADDAIETCRVLKPSVILVHADLPEATRFLDSVRQMGLTMTVIVLSVLLDLERVMIKYQHLADDFAFESPSLISVKLSLSSALENKSGPIGDAGETESQAVDTERFIAVRQILEKMSLIVQKIALDAQGGITYFGETPYFISIHGCDLKVLSANASYLKYFGNKIGDHSWSIFCGKPSSPETCPVGRTAGTGRIMKTRAVVRYKSGIRIPVVVHTAPIFDNDGQMVLILEIMAGNKEIERIAQEIRNTQQQYQKLFNAVPCHVAVLDREYHLTAINRKFTEDFGDHTGEVFYDILRPGKFPVYRDPITHTMKTGLSQQGEVLLTAQNGTQYQMMSWTSPILSKTGKLVQVLVIFADVTELRRLQDNLSSLGLMLGSISHDLKGCLTGLDAGLYLIDKGFYRNKPGRVEEGLDVSKLMVDRIRRMVYDILYYAKERETEIRETSVLGFVTDVAEVIAPRLRSANIEFWCDFGTNLGTFHIDTAMMRSALINILENAMEACIEDKSERKHRIAFTAGKKTDKVVLIIKDNGIGVDQQQIKEIFTLFYSSKGRKGTGLGLFLTDKVIRKHDGSITVSSEPGKGTVFNVQLPIQQIK
ncbi:MAG: PAS domain-containing protein [Desulfobacteraceae bacterium]|nr:PAS domain-containing protein [Desulfobacteraceae bacterium]